MGGFLCVRTGPDSDLQSIRSEYQAPVTLLENKGLRLKDTLQGDGFTLFVFDKVNFSSDNVLRFAGGDFAIATGTFFYRRKFGSEALSYLYEDFSDSGSWLPELYGHFGVLLRKHGRLYAFTDYTGLYRIYCDTKRTVLSSSFLAVAKSLPRKTLSKQEFFEYLSHGAMYGDRTLVEEIELLDSYAIHQLFPSRRVIPRSPPSAILAEKSSFQEQVEMVSGQLLEYASILRDRFGDKISTALSGGYDSRLVLGLFRKVGVDPYVYVYGPPESPDVRVAKLISHSEQIPLHNDKSAGCHVELEQFPEVVRRLFYFHDGQGISGAFDDGSDFATRAKRTAAAELQLNGGGGEIYRNFWKLPDRGYTIRRFLKARYERIDFSIYTEDFDGGEYWDNLSAKIKLALRTEGDYLDRRQIELLYPLFRLKYWMGQNNCSNNSLTYALTPFADPVFSIPSADIPLGHKDYGRFEAALIHRVDPSLAAYPSIYGHNFSDPVPLRARVRTYAKVHAPVFARPLFYKYRQRRQTRQPLPFYLTREYIAEVFGSNELHISQYVDLDRLQDPIILSRLLTVELLLEDRF